MKISVFLAMLAFSAPISVANAANVKCSDVVSWASVDYPPSMAVTTASSTGPERYCQFSINGYVSDNNAPAQFKNTLNGLSREFIAMASSNKQTGSSVVTMMPYLLFAADRNVDMKLVATTSEAFKKYSKEFAGCYDEFFSQKKVNPVLIKYDIVTLQCHTNESGNQVETRLSDTVSAFKRITYLSR
jgi:hypothetical protein